MNTSTTKPKVQSAVRHPPPSPWWKHWIVWAAVGALLAVLLLAYLLWQGQASSSALVSGLQTFPAQERGHTEAPVTYAQTPPVGGIHNPAWQNCGIYDAPIADENGVHSLEHGAVWITYQPELDATAVAQLRDLVRGRPFALLSPYPGLPAPVVASAWGLQLEVDDAGDARLTRFLDTYAQGPQTPEPGAVCYGGVGRPVDG